MFSIETIIKLIAAVVITAAVSFALYTGYSHIKQIGYNEAEAKYTQIMREQQDAINKKIDNIASLQSDLITLNTTAGEKLTEDVATILSKVKGKQLVIVKNGECTPSTTFSNSIVEINKRVNQNMKETQK